jgi:TonB family protein
MSSIEVWKTWAGRVVEGKFPLRQWLGGSDHSAVFLTERSGSEPRKAAVKLIAADSSEADHQLARWRAAAQLSHPGLIRIFEAGRCRIDGTPLLYLVMEYAEEDLSQILPQRPLTPAEVGDMLPPLLDALWYLHGKGLVHGRIKPSNVLAVGDQLKLSADQIASDQMASGGLGGSAIKRRDVYDAPETAAGILLPASDLWSVGVTVVAALTQNGPLAEDSPPGHPGLPESIPEPFRGIARECLQLDPKRRCSIAEIKARLQPAGRSVPAPREATVVARRRPGVAPFALAAVVIAVVIGLVVFHSRGKDAAPQNPATSQQSAPAPVADSPTAQAYQPAQPAQTARPAQTAQPLARPVQKATGSKGEVVHQALPDVPQSARNTITGTIKVGVRVEVDASGKVSSATLTSAGPSKYFANLALKAARDWEFSAPEVDGQPVASEWILRFRFKRGGTQASAERARH